MQTRCSSVDNDDTRVENIKQTSLLLLDEWYYSTEHVVSEGNGNKLGRF